MKQNVSTNQAKLRAIHCVITFAAAKHCISVLL